MFTRIIFVITILVATACTPVLVEDSAPPQDIPESPTEDLPDIAVIPSPVAEAGLEKKFIQIATNDLATRLNIDAKSISVISAESITWPNAALGCPSPGKVYAQGKVPGYQIRLEVDGIEYIYNTDLLGQVLLCTQQDPDDLDSLSPTTPGPTQQIGVPID